MVQASQNRDRDLSLRKLLVRGDTAIAGLVRAVTDLRVQEEGVALADALLNNAKAFGQKLGTENGNAEGCAMSGLPRCSTMSRLSDYWRIAAARLCR
jgi:hypothetical protein